MDPEDNYTGDPDEQSCTCTDDPNSYCYPCEQKVYQMRLQDLNAQLEREERQASYKNGLMACLICGTDMYSDSCAFCP